MWLQYTYYYDHHNDFYNNKQVSGRDGQDISNSFPTIAKKHFGSQQQQVVVSSIINLLFFRSRFYLHSHTSFITVFLVYCFIFVREYIQLMQRVITTL